MPPNQADNSSGATSDGTPNAATSMWPSPGWETLRWQDRSRKFDIGPRSTAEIPYFPYKAAIPPFIAETRFVPSPEVVAEAEDATLAIRDFDAEFASQLAPFSAILLRTESVSSSRIENVTANARSIGMAELGDESKRNATLIVDNVAAMSSALSMANTLSPNSILEMHRVLMRHSDPAGAGHWREQQVWIGTSSDSPVGADFVAPAHGRVPDLMDDLATYARRNDISILVQAAIAHAQFETVHPFEDGNGRTGRALLHAMLRAKRLTRAVTVPVSAGLLTDIGSYHNALTAYRAGEPEQIISLCSKATFKAIANGRHLASDMNSIRTRWNDAVSARKDSSVWKIIDLLMRQPIVNADLLSRDLRLSGPTIWRRMALLEEAGIVKGFDKFKRGRHWRADEILWALDDFAARGGRRQRS